MAFRDSGGCRLLNPDANIDTLWRESASLHGFGKMVQGPVALYRGLVREGTLEFDSAQASAAQRLQTLSEQLRAVGLNGEKKTSVLVRLGFCQSPPAPRGIYLFGDVGRGKTMLMDLFYGHAPVDPKRRLHFHAFMLEVHRWIHRWRKNRGATNRDADPIPALAADMASTASLLCFDEFEIRDVADAMIMRRLFSALWAQDVVVVMTSNWSPDDLYLNGLQRELFLPFIALIKDCTDVIKLDSKFDYRLRSLRQMQVYFASREGRTGFKMQDIFHDLVGNVDVVAETLLVDGRLLKIPRVNQGIAWLTFEELCGRSLGAADYLEIAARYHTLLLSDIPVMTVEQRDKAKRFAILIDILYEHNVKLVCSAAADPKALCPPGNDAYEFNRTVSRLSEMQTTTYLSRPHTA